jgi:hypothetical protein
MIIRNKLQYGELLEDMSNLLSYSELRKVLSSTTVQNHLTISEIEIAIKYMTGVIVTILNEENLIDYTIRENEDVTDEVELDKLINNNRKKFWKIAGFGVENYYISEADYQKLADYYNRIEQLYRANYGN